MYHCHYVGRCSRRRAGACCKFQARRLFFRETSGEESVWKSCSELQRRMQFSSVWSKRLAFANRSRRHFHRNPWTLGSLGASPSPPSFIMAPNWIPLIERLPEQQGNNTALDKHEFPRPRKPFLNVRKSCGTFATKVSSEFDVTTGQIFRFLSNNPISTPLFFSFQNFVETFFFFFHSCKGEAGYWSVADSEDKLTANQVSARLVIS